MLETIITSSLLIAVLILLRYLLRGKISLRLQYALWLLVAVRLLMPFCIFESSLSVLNIMDFNRQAEQIENPVVRIGAIAIGLWFIMQNIWFYARLRKTREPAKIKSSQLPVYLSRHVKSPCLFGIRTKPSDLLLGATTMTSGKSGIKERITMIAKKPKMAIYTLVAVTLIAAVAVGCTFTEAKIEKSEIIPLTAEEIEQYNKIFEPLIIDVQGNTVVNPRSHFLTSYYDRPEDINLAECLRYFPAENDVTDEAEFMALKEAANWPFGADMTMERMPVPVHKFSAGTVNGVLLKNMGITLDDLSGVGMDELIYLESYDAYYNFTSDFAAGSFVCTSGETQGDIIRLYSERTTLTLKKHGDSFLFVSHQRAGAATDYNNGAVAAGIDVRIEAEGNIPDAVIEYAKEYVGQQMDHYNTVGKESETGTYTITDAKITRLTKMNTGTASLTTDIQMWLLEYRLLPDNSDKVMLAGGMRMEEMGGQSWLTEWGSTGQPYLLLASDDSGAKTTWRRICVTNTDVIKVDYGTPEMLKHYGNEYTAAAMELYRKTFGITGWQDISIGMPREDVHKIMGEPDGMLSGMFGEYGFENGNFVKVSGSGIIPVVFTFTNSENGLVCTKMEDPEGGARYGDSIRRMFPSEYWDRVLSPSDSVQQELKSQERAYAASYLKEIGRDAVIGNYGDFEHVLLTDVGVSVEVSNSINDKQFSNYPMWIGNREALENGIRYVYEMSYKEIEHEITFKKYDYNTKTIVELTRIDSVTGLQLP